MSKVKTEFANVKCAYEALEQMGGLFTVSPREIMTVDGIEIPEQYANVRDDNREVFGVVGSRYTIIQNTEAFALMDVIAEKFDSEYQYGYNIRGGRKMILQAEIGDRWEAKPGDEVANYLTMIHSFDGSTPLSIYFTPRRMICQNQLRASLREAINKVSIRHTASCEARMQEAVNVFMRSTEYFGAFAERSKVFAQKMMDSRMVETFLEEVIKGDSTRAKNQREVVEGLYQSGKGNVGQSMWDAYNAVTEYVDHFQFAKKDEDRQYEAALDEAQNDIKIKAWNVLEKMI